MANVWQSASDRCTQIATRLVLELADRQFGVVARWQLEECGLTGATVSRWVAAGRLQRIYPRVYAVGHRALTIEGKLLAAILYAGPGAALSHESAAHWWRLLSHLPGSIHVCTPKRRRSLPAVRTHRSRGFERVLHRGLPVTTVPRTLVDLAHAAPTTILRGAVAEADFLRILDLDAIDATLTERRPGSARLKQALELHRPEYARTRSDLEDELLDLCRRYSLPFPEVNLKLCGYTVDALWRDARVVVEVDGRSGHGTIARMERDRQRDLALRAAGFSVHRYTWRQMTTRSKLVAADLRRALSLPAASVPAVRAKGPRRSRRSTRR
jgi:very-short-patch-repair endonuclease